MSGAAPLMGTRKPVAGAQLVRNHHRSHSVLWGAALCPYSRHAVTRDIDQDYVELISFVLRNVSYHAHMSDIYRGAHSEDYVTQHLQCQHDFEMSAIGSRGRTRPLGGSKTATLAKVARSQSFSRVA
jgi:hypothetical protein